MPKTSAGLLPYRFAGDVLEVLLVHPGGPFWAKRDEGSWSIAKGEVEDGEDPRAAALREFEEETGLKLPALTLLELGDARQPSRKLVIAFAADIDVDPGAVASNLVEIVWPSRSGRRITVPEIDRAGWFTVEEARGKILSGQVVFLDRLSSILDPAGSGQVRQRT